MKYLIAISILILTGCSGPKKAVAPPPTGGWNQYPILLGGQGFKLVFDTCVNWDPEPNWVARDPWKGTDTIRPHSWQPLNGGLSTTPIFKYTTPDPVLKGLDTIKVFLLCNRSYDWGDGDFITIQRSGYEVRQVWEHQPPMDNMFGEKPYIYYNHVKYLDSKYQEFKDWYVWMSRPVPEKIKKK